MRGESHPPGLTRTPNPLPPSPPSARPAQRAPTSRTALSPSAHTTAPTTVNLVRRGSTSATTPVPSANTIRRPSAKSVWPARTRHRRVPQRAACVRWESSLQTGASPPTTRGTTARYAPPELPHRPVRRRARSARRARTTRALFQGLALFAVRAACLWPRPARPVLQPLTLSPSCRQKHHRRWHHGLAARRRGRLQGVSGRILPRGNFCRGMHCLRCRKVLRERRWGASIACLGNGTASRDRPNAATVVRFPPVSISARC